MPWGGGIEICLVDNYKTGQEQKTGLKIITPPQMAERYGHSNIVIVNTLISIKFMQEINTQLIEMGFKNEDIYTLEDIALIYEGSPFYYDEISEISPNYIPAHTDALKRASEWIGDKDLSVIDCGAGSMYLKELLPEGVAYYPVDFKERCPQTIVCDFNTDPFPDISADVVCVLGLLMYIKNLEGFIRDVCSAAKNKVLLLHPSDELVNAASGRIWKLFGHSYSMSFADIVDTFEVNGFVLSEQGVWQNRLLCCFKKSAK